MECNIFERTCESMQSGKTDFPTRQKDWGKVVVQEIVSSLECKRITCTKLAQGESSLEDFCFKADKFFAT